MRAQTGVMGSSLSFGDEKLRIIASIRRVDLNSDKRFYEFDGREISPNDVRQFFPQPDAIEWREVDVKIFPVELFGRSGDFRINLNFPGDPLDETKKRFLEWLKS